MRYLGTEIAREVCYSCAEPFDREDVQHFFLRPADVADRPYVPVRDADVVALCEPCFRDRLVGVRVSEHLRRHAELGGKT
jgi:hypothetical protein